MPQEQGGFVGSRKAGALFFSFSLPPITEPDRSRSTSTGPHSLAYHGYSVELDGRVLGSLFGSKRCVCSLSLSLIPFLFVPRPSSPHLDDSLPCTCGCRDSARKPKLTNDENRSQTGSRSGAVRNGFDGRYFCFYCQVPQHPFLQLPPPWSHFRRFAGRVQVRPFPSFLTLSSSLTTAAPFSSLLHSRTVPLKLLPRPTSPTLLPPVLAPESSPSSAV